MTRPARTMPRPRRTLLVTVLLALCALSSHPAPGQQGAARAALDTWIETVNTASPAELEAYALATFSEGFLAQVPLAQILAVHQQLKGAGAFELGPIESETDGALVALVRASGGAWFRAQLRLAGDPPKIDGFLIQPAEAPAESAPAPLEWETLDELAARLAEADDLPGVAVAWARPGDDPVIGVAGVRAAGGGAPIETGDAFHIGSITKSFTAAALAALVEDGTLAWEATLAELLPGVAMSDAFAAMDLSQLLRHQARIPQHLTMNNAEMSRLNGLPGTPTEQRAAYTAEVLSEQPLEEGYAYSNAGYAIAGYIGERASGGDWARLVRDKVFEPLGLASCGTGWPATAAVPDQPHGHYGGPGARRVQGIDDYPLGAFLDPAGDIHCAIGDLIRYGLAHLAGLEGEDGFLSAASIRELHRVLDGGAPYAAGWGIDPESGQHRHNGSAGTFYAYLVIDPSARIVAAFVTNAGPPEAQVAGGRAVEAMLLRYATR